MNLRYLTVGLLLGPILFLSAVSCTFLESDTEIFQFAAFYDLRNRDSFVQVTNASSSAVRVHVQVFNVDNNCNENNFYDNLTGNDTHVYNLKDIQTNDGNPSGIVLPGGAYGVVVITAVDITDNSADALQNSLISNFRVIGSNGVEYRANSQGAAASFTPDDEEAEDIFFNYNQDGGIVLSDIIGFTLSDVGDPLFEPGPVEVVAADILTSYLAVDVDILDLNENIFSCRNVIFACTDQDNPLLEELLAEVGVASVASFEYGINNAIPHTMGGELLCPGNNIAEGIVRLRPIESGDEGDNVGFGLYVGLNNGDGRGSMDAHWVSNLFLDNNLISPDGI